MALIAENKIVLVQFLDLLTLSILSPAVPPTILKTGGSLMHLGCLMSITAAAKIISTRIFAELLKTSGKRSLLQYSLLISCTLNALLYFTSSYYGIMMNRVLFVCFHQIPHLSSLLISKGDKNQSPLENPAVQRLTAVLSGCATVGYLIDSQGGFYVLVALGTAISVVATAIAMQEQPQEKEKEKQLVPSEVVGAVRKTIDSTIKDIKDTDIHFANRDALLVKSLLVINAKVVFILFVVLIIFAFQGKGSLVNATAAYHTIIIALSGLVFNELNLRVNNLTSPKEILKMSLKVCTVFAFLQSFAPNHSFYLIMFIPFVLSRTFVEYYFNEVFETRKNQKLAQDLETVTTITDIVAPLFIGILIQLFKPNAYRLLTITPFIAIYYIVSKNDVKELKPEETSKTKEDKKEAEKEGTKAEQEKKESDKDK